jgi:predicted PurR-regulated permease PerM
MEQADHPSEGYSEAEENRRQEQAEREMRETSFDAPTVSLVVLATLAVLFTLYLAADIVIPLLLAVVLNLLLQPARRFLTDRLRLPAPITALLLILVLFSFIGALGAALSVPASHWVGRFPETLSALQQKLGHLQGPIDFLRHGMERLQNLVSQPPPQGQQVVKVEQPSNLGGVGFTVLEGTRAFMGKLFELLVVLFFLLTSGDTIRRNLVEIMPSLRDKRRVVEITDEVERQISGYLATITMMNALVGIGNGISAYFCGLPDPLLWGTAAFLLNYIPILGPFVGVVLFFIVGIFTYSTIWYAFIPAGIYLAIHVTEGETITPMLLASRFTLNPVLVIVALFFWDWMWGVIGALLAVPLLAISKIVCDHIPSLTPLGHMLGGRPRRRPRS